MRRAVVRLIAGMRRVADDLRWAADAFEVFADPRRPPDLPGHDWSTGPTLVVGRDATDLAAAAMARDAFGCREEGEG